MINGNQEKQQTVIQPLPKDFSKFSSGYMESHFATERLSYLKDRGISKQKIQAYNIGYSNWLRRIIFPSYSQSYQLNFWTSRRLSGKNPWKHCNGDVTKMVFNQFFVNWDLPIVLVQGVFDWLNMYNSIPLLGGSLSKNSILYKTLRLKKPKIILRMDNDAKKGTNKIVNLLINIGQPLYILRYNKKDLGQYKGQLKFKITKDFKFISNDQSVYVQKIQNHLKILLQSL